MSLNIDGVQNRNSINPRGMLSLQAPAQPGQAAPVAQGPADGSAISKEARGPQMTDERRELLDGLKKNLGGGDRIQVSDSKMNSLSTDQLKSVKKKREFDVALTKHEDDHHEVAADLARSGPLYETEVGEDGVEYRKSGKVMIDTGEDQEGDDEKTVKKMQQVRAAALAPDGNQLAPLSEQDKKVAAEATDKETKAQRRLDAKASGKEISDADKPKGGNKGPKLA